MDYSDRKYGAVDFNNDNIDDLTSVYMFFPSNRLPYYCDYKFVDGATGRLLDFSKYFSTQATLHHIEPYRYGDKNYFVCVLGGYGNYVIKLIEIKGIEPIELHSWMVSVINRILVEVSESTGSYWGI